MLIQLVEQEEVVVVHPVVEDRRIPQQEEEDRRIQPLVVVDSWAVGSWAAAADCS